jgi:hypothetical protein
MFLLNGSPIGLDTPFTHDEIQYPANWIRLASQEERAAIGITEEADPERYDDRFYWGVGNPKDLDMLKIWLVNEVKVTAGTLLAPTDWKVIRATETNTAVDGGVLADRATIRAASNANEAAINACATVDELAALQLNWPS